MTFALSNRSKSNLVGVHRDLVRVVEHAIKITKVDFAVIEGTRTIKRQRELFKAGATTTMRSRHITGHAVNLAAVVGGEIRWDWPLYDQIARAMKDAAADLGVALEWGGDWTTFKDGPHFQLSRKGYP